VSTSIAALQSAHRLSGTRGTGTALWTKYPGSTSRIRRNY
jgi:hypothetical protein